MYSKTQALYRGASCLVVWPATTVHDIPFSYARSSGIISLDFSNAGLWPSIGWLSETGGETKSTIANMIDDTAATRRRAAVIIRPAARYGETLRRATPHASRRAAGSRSRDISAVTLSRDGRPHTHARGAESVRTNTRSSETVTSRA